MRLLGGRRHHRHLAAAVGGAATTTATNILILLSIFLSNCITNTYGGCEFPSHWTGRWFQSGVGILQMNRTSIETKGECFDSQGDKFMVFDRLDDCYRCLVIHEKHHSVLQYKETYCDQKTSLAEMCYSITGDAPLYSMFRKYPEPKTVSCPFFKQAPFTFTYNRGSGECSNPPSRAESCTDNSRLVLKYQACPDIQSTESNVEELVCVATWKEGSTRYLVGKLNQVSRRTALPSDEDQYRCFIYERVSVNNGQNKNIVTYHVAQSGDATCNGLQSAVEGSRTIQLTQADSHHGRCSFPSWLTDHHTWFSLDHSRIYKFNLKNATLRIIATAEGGGGPVVAASASDSTHTNRHHAHDHPPPQSSEGGGGSTSTSASTEPHPHSSNANQPTLEEEGKVRLVCHSILQSVENRRVQIVAHVTAGCDSGYVCMVFHKRDSSVIEIQQSEMLHENTDDACGYFNPAITPYTTLIAPALHPTRCPHPGRYTVIGAKPPFTQEEQSSSRKKRRQVQAQAAGPGVDSMNSDAVLTPPHECLSHDYDALAVGCATHEQLEFRSPCLHQPISAYTCHGSWQENNTFYVIASPVARKSTDALRYCLVYTFDGDNSTVLNQQQLLQQQQEQQTLGIHYGTTSSMGGPQLGSGGATAQSPPSFILQSGMIMRLSGLADSCHRHITPGSSGLWAFNFTTNGPCNRFGDTGAASIQHQSSSCFFLLVMIMIVVVLRPFR